MKRFFATCKALASFVFLFALTSVAQAQLTHTWVAGDGNDANPCTRAAPCRTFAAALSQTNAGGEINAKNAGEFGTVTIDKSITIDGGGTFSGIHAPAGSNAVFINDSTSPTPGTAVVTLRNLSINGGGTSLAAYGVAFYHGKTLNIENCQIFNFSWAGIAVTASGSNINIKNTRIFMATVGLDVNSATASTTVSLNGCNIDWNTTAGVSLGADVYASIRDSVIQFNHFGVLVTMNTVNIVDSQINNNSTGLWLFLAATATLGSSTFMDNNTSFSNNGTIQTFGNNQTETAIPGTATRLGLQ